MTTVSTSAVTTWAVYDHPTDQPDYYVARRFDGLQPTENTLMSRDYAVIERELMRRGRTRIPRHPDDDPKIMEVWL